MPRRHDAKSGSGSLKRERPRPVCKAALARAPIDTHKVMEKRGGGESLVDYAERIGHAGPPKVGPKIDWRQPGPSIWSLIVFAFSIALHSIRNSARR